MGITGKDKETLLIVDDEPGNRKILMEILSPYYKITAAASGEQALNRIAKGVLPDLILLDIMMPEIDGYEVCRRLKDKAQTKDIPIIFITALNDVANETKGFEVGAVDYIVKPFHTPVVMARVNTHIALKRKTDLLESLASLDGLTEIPNRRRFDEILEMEWKRARRNQTFLSLILMDIDFFKQFNDNYGHSKGDVCLRFVAKAIEQSKRRPADFAARYGGEAFALLLPETNQNGALNMADTVHQKIADLAVTHAYSSVSDLITLSLGIATMDPENAWPIDEVIEFADQALYRAKHNGRNQTAVYC